MYLLVQDLMHIQWRSYFYHQSRQDISQQDSLNVLDGNDWHISLRHSPTPVDTGLQSNLFVLFGVVLDVELPFSSCFKISWAALNITT